jgi:hypothetical protein
VAGDGTNPGADVGAILARTGDPSQPILRSSSL